MAAQPPILTIAVPIYNMERWLDKNLTAYCDPALAGRVEVICLNNASTDSSSKIISRYVEAFPQTFSKVIRDSRGYGGSINYAIQRAAGAYFRIVDADDWVDTGELIKEVNVLETCHADIVLTDYEIVNMRTGKMTLCNAGNKGAEYNVVFRSFDRPQKTLPSIHSTTYSTQLLRKAQFQMQDGIFFVDEEYVVLPYLAAESVIYYPFDVYRYRVANPEQSTSPKNRGKYQEHRLKVLKRLITAYKKAAERKANPSALAYCFERIKRGIGDHFTTLYIYVDDKRQSRKLAKEWAIFVQEQIPEAWVLVKRKAHILSLINWIGISIRQYENLKRVALGRRQ